MKSITEIFQIGRGPGANYTIGVTKACQWILNHTKGQLVNYIVVNLYKSFALASQNRYLQETIESVFSSYKCRIFHHSEYNPIITYPYTIEFVVYDIERKEILRKTILAVGGGNICVVGEPPSPEVYHFDNFVQISDYITKHKLSYYEFITKHEDKAMVDKLIDDCYKNMNENIQLGLKSTSNIINGEFVIEPQAKKIFENWRMNETDHETITRTIMAYSYAFSERAISRHETAVAGPGCSGIAFWPAVKYISETHKLTTEQIRNGICAAAIIALIVYQNATFSASVAGCQAEIGTACAMAGAFYSATVFNANIDEVGNTATACFEHCLGLTCDDVRGLRVVPCMNRAATYALRAMQTAELTHLINHTLPIIHFDDIVKTMYETGKALHESYRDSIYCGLSKNARHVIKRKVIIK